VDEPTTHDLVAQALAARQSAYCPYSGFAVGAALLTSSNNVYVGCNVENISFGATICAERNAIAAAVAANMRGGELAALAIVGGPITADARIASKTLPCGACLQVVNEFAGANCRIVCADATADGLGEIRNYHLSDLLPQPFGG